VEVTRKAHWFIGKALSMIKAVTRVIHTCIRYLANAIKYPIVHPACQIVARIISKCQHNSKVQGLCKKLLTTVHWLWKEEPEEGAATSQQHLPNLYDKSWIAGEARMVGWSKEVQCTCIISEVMRHHTGSQKLIMLLLWWKAMTHSTLDTMSRTTFGTGEPVQLVKLPTNQQWMQAGIAVSIDSGGLVTRKCSFIPLLTMDVLNAPYQHQQMEAKCQETGEV